MKVMLVTGGAGFIGCNFIRVMLEKYPDLELINLDALTYAGSLSNLVDVEGNPNYRFVHADIRDTETVDRVFEDYDVDCVVNFAAESHVDRSILDPGIFLSTNAVGTQVLLDTAKKHWKLHPDDKYSREYKEGVRFHQVSTDEVYGSLGETGLFTEKTPIAPRSPYSASKACADMLAMAYYESFGLPVTISRCSNNYGPYQFPEKLIPLIIKNCLEEKPLPVYGDGMQIRDWLYVIDHCTAIDCILHGGIPGEVYNIGGGCEKTNLELVKRIIRTLGKRENLICFVRDRPGHDRRYAMDFSKLETALGWRPEYSFERGIEKTIDWYLCHTEWIDGILNGDYEKYYGEMYGQSRKIERGILK